MEQYIDIMRRTVELVETCFDAMDFISSRLAEGKMENTLYLIEDFVWAFYHIGNSLALLDSVIYTNVLWDIMNQLEYILNEVLTFYEIQDVNSAIYCVNTKLIPVSKTWYQELTSVFNSHILS